MPVRRMNGFTSGFNSSDVYGGFKSIGFTRVESLSCDIGWLYTLPIFDSSSIFRKSSVLAVEIAKSVSIFNSSSFKANFAISISFFLVIDFFIALSFIALCSSLIRFVESTVNAVSADLCDLQSMSLPRSFLSHV